MNTRFTRIAFAMLALSAMPLTACASNLPGFGFNYWPQGYAGCEALTEANWPQAQKKVAADLGLMKSIGADTVRLTFWPTSSGFNGGWPPSSAAACPKLPQLLQTVRDSGFKAIIAFSNTYVLQDERCNNLELWKCIYHPGGAGPGKDYNQFLIDSVKWANGIVDKAQGSSASDTVLYYDLQNEYDIRLDQIDYYFRTLYQWSHVPAEKRGLSILRAPEDIDPAEWKSIPTQLQVLSQGSSTPATLAFVEYHSYPVVPRERCPLHPDIKLVRTQMQTRFPQSTIVLGEFGRRAIQTPNNDATIDACAGVPRAGIQQVWDEPGQQATELDLIARAKQMGGMRYLHWMLWDNTPPDGRVPTDSAAQVYGYGYTPYQPKDVIGAIAATYGAAPNGDMETNTGGAPSQWTSGQWHASGPNLSLSLFVSGGSDAATGNSYARLQTPSTCNACTVWMQSQTFALPQGSSTVSVNAFVRSNMSDVHVNLVQLDASGQMLSSQAVLEGPKIQTPTSNWPAWYNYLATAHLTSSIDGSRSWRFTLSPNAAKAFITIGGTPTLMPGILDVDAVTTSVD